ncbi:MAG: universal stress protein [Flavobacterium sp.]|nr:MAG: universal stress protein [Flavobacterium sp.]
MKTLLVAIDFSAEADNAMAFAASAAAEKGYSLVLYNFYNTSIHAMNARLSGSKIDKLMEWRRDKVREMADFVSQNYGVKISIYFACGNFYTELLACIKLHNADLVVMGMAEKSLEQDLLGNTTTEVIYKLNTPVLSVPLQAKYKRIKHILFACDIARGIHLQILEKVKEFASDFRANVEVFSVVKKAQEIASNQVIKDVDQSLGNIGHYYKHIESNAIIKAINEEIITSETDLLIMVPHKHGFWNSLLHTSKTRIMASGNSVPLLSISLG